MENNEDEEISIVMREVFYERDKTKEREMAGSGQRQWRGNIKPEDSWNLDYRMSLGQSRWRRELCKWATYHRGNLQKREERGDEEENEREVPFVTPVKA